MFLQEKNRKEMVEVLTLKDLFDPYCDTLIGRYQHGEEVQDPETFKKVDLWFLSGETLPRCWIDPHYHEKEMQR